jgi:hypothetical protein
MCYLLSHPGVALRPVCVFDAPVLEAPVKLEEGAEEEVAKLARSLH